MVDPSRTDPERGARPSDAREPAALAFETDGRVLADPRRWCVVEYLLEADERVVERSELAAAVSRAEPDDEGSDRRCGSPVRAVEIDLHHNQLPRLDEAGVVAYDERSGTVRYEGHPGIEAVLDRDRDDPSQ